jgi:hypothetical protein
VACLSGRKRKSPSASSSPQGGVGSVVCCRLAGDRVLGASHLPPSPGPLVGSSASSMRPLSNNSATTATAESGIPIPWASSCPVSQVGSPSPFSISSRSATANPDRAARSARESPTLARIALTALPKPSCAPGLGGPSGIVSTFVREKVVKALVPVTVGREVEVVLGGTPPRHTADLFENPELRQALEVVGEVTELYP